ncbi:MAG: tetratricopeptide repeat protein [Cyanobacteria bacterium J06623_7]
MFQVDEAQACLKQAQECWQAQQWQKTIQACAQALALNQKLPLAHKLMGDALQRTDKSKEAIGYYRAAIALQPNFTEVYANLGTLCAQQQQYQQAIDYYQQALKLDPNFTAVQKPLVRAQQLLQQHRGAQTSLKDRDLDLSRSLQQGRDLQQQGEWEAALKQYLQAAKLRPQRVDTYREIIKLCEQLGLWADAAKYCRLVLRLTNGEEAESTSLSRPSQPASPPAVARSNNIVPALSKQPQAAKPQTAPPKIAQTQDYLTLGQTLERQGNHQGAVDCYQRAIQQQPQGVDGYLALGELLFKQGRIDSAVSTYLAALKQQHHPQLYFNLGKIYQGKKQLPKAALCYQKSIQLDSQQLQACHELGEVFSQQQQWSEAVRAYRQAVALKTDFSWTYNNLGYALIQLGQWSEAISPYLQAIKLKPDFPWSYYNLAEAYGKLGQWERAIAAYDRAAQLQPDLPQVQQKLGDAYYRRSQQDRQRALERFRLAIGQDPYNPDVYHQALAIDNRNLDLYLKLGDILANSGKSEQALVTYQMALQVQPKNTEILTRIQQYQGLNLVTAEESIHQPAELPTADYEAMVAELEQILPYSDTPAVSIIIPVYNQLDYTLKCLKAISVNLDKSLPVEIILVNDCSTDSTAKVLQPLTKIDLVNQTTNQGFIHSCNLGAARAKGEYIYFLNNDTEIKPNCIASLVEVLVRDEQVGAVGSKLVYPQGSLQEAGGIVWSDASGWNYGRQDNPFAPEYNYLREVDYCSGASLMVRQAIFSRLNGFEQDFVPAYYEDTDLCFAIRHQLGLKVMYQPKSEVIHYEGISSGTSVTSGTKKYQVVNALKFKQKWLANLERGNYLPNVGIDNVPTAVRKYLGQQTILVVDSYMPSYDRESGSRRLFELLKIFKSLNYHVIFAADNGVKHEPYTSVLQDLQIEVLYTQEGYGTAIAAQIESRLPLIDIAWICRPELNQKYAGLIRQQPEIKLIYDTIDLHYLRLKRAWNLDPSHCSKETWVEMQGQELKMAHLADMTITVTAKEQQVLEVQGVDRVRVIPNIHRLVSTAIPEFESRQGILFIGSYNHLPNIDAVQWLCQEIMPLVWQVKPEIKVTLLGNKPTDEVMALQSDRIAVTGYVEDVSPYFLSHKLSVSPLRYGAGMKGKIGQSLEYSLPMVSTAIGTEGMNLIREQQILEAENSLNFAQQIVRLYTDRHLWNLISRNAQGAISHYSPQAVRQEIQQIFQQIQTLGDNLKKSD